jgi:hypothetical protein
MSVYPPLVACPSNGHSVDQFLALHKRFFAVQVKINTTLSLSFK